MADLEHFSARFDVALPEILIEPREKGAVAWDLAGWDFWLSPEKKSVDSLFLVRGETCHK